MVVGVGWIVIVIVMIFGDGVVGFGGSWEILVVMKIYVVCGLVGVVDEFEVSVVLFVDEEMVLGVIVIVVDVVDGCGRIIIDVDMIVVFEFEVRFVLKFVFEVVLELDIGGFFRL